MFSFLFEFDLFVLFGEMELKDKKDTKLNFEIVFRSSVFFDDLPFIEFFKNGQISFSFSIDNQFNSKIKYKINKLKFIQNHSER